ncbi:MAG: glycosyltransferase [Chloroflexota bacterium]
MRILFLSGWFPYPPSNGSKLRILSLLRGLATRHEVTLLTFADQTGAAPDVPELRSLCREVAVVPQRAFNPASLKARLGFFSPLPRSVVDTYSPEMEQRILETIAQRHFDLVIASQIATAHYGRLAHEAPALLEEVEIGVLHGQYAQPSSAWKRFRNGLTWAKHRRYLASLLPRYAGCTVVSERERALLSRAVPDYRSVDVIPNCVNVADYASIDVTPRQNTLVFTGSFRYAANYEAMVWFLDQVYPQVRRTCPEVHLTVTGDHAGLPLPDDEGYDLTGVVDDVRPVIAGASASLAPILDGGGTRLKILEAMALRTPVVATSKGAEGLDVQDGEHLLIADTPADFASAVIRVLKDARLRERLAENAYQLVRAKYDWATVMPRFLDLVERVASS